MKTLNSQAKKNLTKSEFDDKFYSHEKISRQLYVARNIKSLLEKEEFRSFSKEQIKFIAEKSEGNYITIERDFEKFNFYKRKYTYIYDDLFDEIVELFCFKNNCIEEIKDYLDEVQTETEEDNEVCYISRFENVNVNEVHFACVLHENCINNECDSFKEYAIYIPKDCIFSSFDEDIVEIIKKFNL